MKKNNFYIAAALFAGSLLATNAQALDLAQGAAGEVASFTVTIPGAKDLLFSPSNNVVMNGESEETSFQVNGYHTAALGKAAGQAYAMTADSNTMWFFAIEDETADTAFAIGGTNSGDLSGANYTKM
jgi:hypothetical protein